MLDINKRGDRYLRTLVIHGARAATRVAEGKRDARSIWVSRLKLRGGPNVAAVALANKKAVGDVGVADARRLVPGANNYGPNLRGLSRRKLS